MHGIVCLTHQNNNDGEVKSSRAVAAAAAGDTSQSVHYNVEHRVIMDSGGVRVQVSDG